MRSMFNHLQIHDSLQNNNIQQEQIMLSDATFAFIFQNPNGSTHVFRLGQIVPTFYSASNSVILALAAYLTWRYPSLPHPKYINYPLDEVKVSENFPTSELSLHPLYEAWCDSMCDSVIQGNALRSGSTLYLLIYVTQQFSETLAKINWERQTFIGKVSINKIFNLEQIDKKENKIILMNFATSQLRQNQLMPKIHLPALLLGTLYDNQNWSYYCALKGEIPTKEELVSADTLIFPGSSNSVLDSIAPVQQLVSELNQAYLENPKLKIMSICYGHQLVAKIHGASIVRKNRFEGHQIVGFNKQLTSKYQFLQKITDHMEKDFIMPEHHEDYVEEVPQGFDLIATSNSCFVEAMVKKDGRILSLQFHPQYLSQYTIAFTKRAQLAKAHFHVSFALQIEPEKLSVHHECCTYVRQCMKAFIESVPQQ